MQDCGLEFSCADALLIKSSSSVKSSLCRWSETERHWKGHSKLSVLGTGFPLSPIKWRMYSVETRWPRGAFLPASIKSFYFSFFPFNISDKKKKWFGVYVTASFLYPSSTLTSSKGNLWIFNQLFLAAQRRSSRGDISSGICNQPSVEQLLLPLQNSRCRYLWLWFLFFQSSSFSLTSGPLRLGVKKCSVSCRLLVWEEFLCICPDRKVLTHSEGRTQRRSGCVAALCDLKAICTGQDIFASGAKQMSLDSVDCVCNTLFQKADILTCYSQNSLSNDVLIPLKFPG